MYYCRLVHLIGHTFLCDLLSMILQNIEVPSFTNLLLRLFPEPPYRVEYHPSSGRDWHQLDRDHIELRHK
jgi:hypothetical protein